jgi:hypothetical protein
MVGSMSSAAKPRSRRHLDRWTRRKGAQAEVTVSCSYSRYRRGEFLVTTTYHLADGAADEDPRRRLTVGDPASPVLEALWDLLFDAVAAAQQYEVRSVTLALDLDGFDRIWRQRLRAVAALVVHELGGRVKNRE